MVDIADVANGIMDEHLARGIQSVTRARFDPGEPGECDECGEDMPRLVNGRCAPCRDGRTWGRNRPKEL